MHLDLWQCKRTVFIFTGGPQVLLYRLEVMHSLVCMDSCMVNISTAQCHQSVGGHAAHPGTSTHVHSSSSQLAWVPALTRLTVLCRGIGQCIVTFRCCL